MNLYRFFLVLLVTLGVFLLAGCQNGVPRTGFYSSPLQPGDEVVMQKTLTIPPGMARVYLQAGKTTSYGGSNQYAPFCYFLLRDPLPAEQTLEPGIFVVESVWLDTTSVSLDHPVKLVALFLTGEGHGPIAYQFYIKLKAAGQQGATLVCSGAFDDPVSAVPIRLPEVRLVLGDYAEIKVMVPESPAAR